LGFESIWLFDHFQTFPAPTDEITFESFTALSVLVASTSRVRLGHMVTCAGFRNPALVAKMLSTMDVMSGGRMELGIGAGWKRDEPERLGRLADSLEVLRRMLAPGRTVRDTFRGRYSSVEDAINVPKPLQERLPIVVGGNGPNVTWRLAARYADEINLDKMQPADVAAALPVIRSRCEEIGRDPASLRVSVHISRHDKVTPGAERIDRLAGYRDLGVARTIEFLPASARDDDALASYADDMAQAGCDRDATTGKEVPDDGGAAIAKRAVTAVG
jgi:alkanesulfonate monooxygenase SsuD/methylene tetrahydromethanopterin reductase-like flavin-dependent oxidoreductase (luciferase family)